MVSGAVPVAVSVTVTDTLRHTFGTSSVVTGIDPAATCATSDCLMASALPAPSTVKYLIRWPSSSTGLSAGSYWLLSCVGSAGAAPTVKNVRRSPEPPASVRVSVTVIGFAWLAPGTSSVVTGASVSTLAGCDVRTASRFPAVSSDRYLMTSPWLSAGLLAAS